MTENVATGPPAPARAAARAAYEPCAAAVAVILLRFAGSRAWTAAAIAVAAVSA
eukprot:gene17558-10626_t